MTFSQWYLFLNEKYQDVSTSTENLQKGFFEENNEVN